MSYQLELRQINYFLTLAEELHFRKASEKLYISQPGLSKQIKEIESITGIQLFDRHNRKVELTNAGEYLQTELAKQMRVLNQTLTNAKLIHDGLKGELKVCYVGSAMQQIIPKLMIDFRRSNSDILFHLNELDNQIQIEQIISGSMDIGFVRMERVPKGLQSIQVLVEPFSLVLPKDHKINSSNFKDFSQLQQDSFILFDPTYSPSYYEKVMQIFDDCSFTPIVTHNTIHSNSIYKLVENHFGLSIVPRSLKMEYLTGVRFIDLDMIPQRTTLSAVWNENSRNPVLQDFISALHTSG